MGWEVVIIILLILGNGVFSLAEIALVSARRTRLQRLANEGKRQAIVALDLASKPSKFLSTVQFGMTLVGILAGAFGGATIAESLNLWLMSFPPLRPYSHALALGAVVLAITYLTLILGELIPKRLALARPEQIACLVAIPMKGLLKVASPMVALLSHPTDWGLRLLGISPSEEPPVTEEELRILIDQGTRAGVFEASEQEMLVGVLRLKDRRARDLITPRKDIVWLDLDEQPGISLGKLRTSGFAAFPVCQGSLDNVVGVIQAKDLLPYCFAGGGAPDLKECMQPPLLVPENRPVLDLLAAFRETRSHMAMVLDEYGGISGVVTATDIVVSVVGSLPAPGVRDEPRAIRREDGSWLLDGMLPADEFRDLFHLPGNALDEEGYRTVGGLVMDRLKKVPTSGEAFQWFGLRIEVMDMDEMRVDKVLVQDLRDRPTGPRESAEE